MVRIPPLLPPPGRPQRNFRIPPPPLIKSPASGLAINALCNSLYASSGSSVVICFVNVGVSMKSMNDYTPLGDSCKEVCSKVTDTPGCHVEIYITVCPSRRGHCCPRLLGQVLNALRPQAF